MTKPLEELRYRLWVAELGEVPEPRLGSDRPNLWVGTTSGDPEERLATLARSKNARYRSLAGQVVGLRPDLSRAYPPTDATDARRQERKLVQKLRRRGHRVNGVGNTYRVYVIELADAAGTKTGDAGFPWLYVGQTSIPVDERIRQHRDGVRNAKGPLFSRAANRHFVRARPDVYDPIRAVHSRADALALEVSTAERLREAGYSVRQG